MKIEKGVPMPKQDENNANAIVGLMEVRDSIFVEKTRDRARLATACWKLSKSSGKKFISRKINTELEKGWRIWRMK